MKTLRTHVSRIRLAAVAMALSACAASVDAARGLRRVHLGSVLLDGAEPAHRLGLA